MDDDTKKREPGCTCHQEEGDSECVVHDPPTCKRCGCEYTMEWPNTEPTTYCDACAHVVVEAAEARAERAEARISELCQCRRPEAGRDGYTCERCEDAAATAALRATVKVGIVHGMLNVEQNVRPAVNALLAAARAEAVAPVLAVLRQLVAAMPVCEWDEYQCKDVATRHAYKQQFFCAVHQFSSDVQPVEWAAPLRAALALLAAHDKAASAGAVKP